jgi:hypothetical protein
MTFSKKDIMSLVSHWNVGYWSYETMKNHIDAIINFLIDTDLLDWDTERKKGDYFLNKEINLIQKTKGNYEGYEYNTTTSILLISLCENEDTTFYQNLLKGKYSTEKDAEEWFVTICESINKQKTLWYQNGEKNDWEVISTNLESICYNLTKLERNKVKIDDINIEVATFYAGFMALPDDKKRDAYGLIKNRLKRINDDIDEVVNGVEDDSGKITGGLDREDKHLYAIDIEHLIKNLVKNW